MSPLSELRVLQARVVDRYALSAVQAGMLVHALERSDEPGLDVQQVSITVQHPLDAALYVYAWYTVMERHPALRSRIRWTGLDQPMQEVLDAIELPVVRADWRGLDAAALRSQLQAVAHRERMQGFDLAQAPLMRLHLARLGDISWNILWTFHHVLLDGRAFDTVLRETFEVHDCLRQRKEVSLPPATLYRNDLEHEDLFDDAKDLPYWRNYLKGAVTPTPLGIDLPAAAASHVPAEQHFGARLSHLTLDETKQLRARAASAGVTLNTLLLAAWGLLLSRYGGSTDIVFGTTRSLRHRLTPPCQDATGLLINTVPVRQSIDLQQPIDDWLLQLRDQQLSQRAHEHVALARIHQSIGLAPGQRLFETLVVYDHRSLTQRMKSLGGDWEARHVDHVGQTGFALTLVAYGDPQFLLRIEYDRRRFSDGAMERLLGHLSTLLNALASDRFERVGQLPWVTPGEQQALIGGPALTVPPRGLLHEAFEAHARRTPHAPALTVRTEAGLRVEWSYRQLNERANALARQLRLSGVQPGECVALRCERNADLALSLLAILKAGAGYLPLDPVYPQERAAYMLEDAQARVLVCSPGLANEWVRADSVSIVIVDMQRQPDDAEAADLVPVGSPDDLAYVIYTSGSTGQPKGVPISHYNVTRLFDASQSMFGFDERDVWTLFHSYAFDFSVWEMWGAWLYGGRLVCVSHDQSRDPVQFGKLLLEERVTVLNQTPTAFRRLVEEACADEPWPLSLRYVIFGGEGLDLQSLRPWFERYGDGRPQLVNMYGITETTVHVTARFLQASDLDSALGSVIGEPLPDLRLYLINESGELVPRGVPGEIAVAGAGLSRGYLRRPELTAERFVRDPFSPEPDARLYLSGDLARWLDNGDLEYLGRRDQQVKLRGFRIELGEIESLLARHPHVRQVAVVAREDLPGDRRLVAYVVPALLGRGVPEGAPEPELASALRAHLRLTLPDYMVPAHFICIDELPLTRNGKLDRASLPSPSERSEMTAASKLPTEHDDAADGLAVQLSAIWAEVLRVPQVGLDQHFMELGGDSILSIQVVARARRNGWPLTMRDLIDHPTVRQLAQRLRQLLPDSAFAVAASVQSPDVRGGSAAETSAPTPEHIPLTPIQQWFFAQQFAEPQHWNQAFAFELKLPVSSHQVQVAWHWLVEQHPALRQRFVRESASRILQPPPDALVAPVLILHAGHLDGAQTVAMIEERATEAQAGLSYERGPLARALFVDAGAERAARLVLIIHHLVVDGVSWRVLREDLEAALLALRQGEPLPLLPPSASTRQWAVALAAHARRTEVKEQLPFWLGQCAGASWQPPAPASASGLSAVQWPMTSVCRRRLSAPLTQGLLKISGLALSPDEKVTVQAALLSGLSQALHKVTGQREWRIDMEGHGREPIDAAPGAPLDVSRTVGWFTSLFPFRLDCLDSADALAHLAHTQAGLASVPSKGLGFGLLRWFGTRESENSALANAGAAPLLFNYLGQWDAVLAGSELMRPAQESTGPWRSPSARPSHLLEAVCVVRDGCLELETTYAAEAVDANWVARLMDGWADDLGELVRSVDPAIAPAPVESARVESAPVESEPHAIASQTDEPANGLTDHALTPLQQLFVAMSGGEQDPGLQQWQFALRGRVSAAQMRSALGQVVERHGILRTAFHHDAHGQARQRALPAAPALTIPWREDDWSAFSEEEQQRLLAAGLESDRQIPFNLATPPLMRVWVIRLAKERWHLVWTTHHLILDGWSWPVLMAEWSRACDGLAPGLGAEESSALQFQDYVAWLEHDWAREHAPDARSYWARELLGFREPTPVGVEPETSAPHSAQAHDCRQVLAADDAKALVLRARQWRVTPGTLVLAAWSAVMAHRADAMEVGLGCTFSGRPAELAGIESLVGPCVNNVPLLVTLQPAQTLQQWLGQLQLQTQDAAEYQYLGLEAIQQLSSMPWQHRLFDNLLVFQNYPQDPDAQRMGTGVVCEALELPQSTAFALTMAVQADPAGWRMQAMGRGHRLGAGVLIELLAELHLMLQRLAQAVGHETVGDWLQQLPAATRGNARRTPKPAPAITQPVPVLPASPDSGLGETLERTISRVWQELLAMDDVPLDTNFFDMGVQSLQLVRAHRLLQERLARPLRLLDMVEHSTVRRLARAWSVQREQAEHPMASSALARARRWRQTVAVHPMSSGMPSGGQRLPLPPA